MALATTGRCVENAQQQGTAQATIYWKVHFREGSRVILRILELRLDVIYYVACIHGFS